MIILSLTAENILKYRRLDLQGLPQRGLIAISGQNESGKSSIGETICFALFGRSFSIEQQDLSKLIHWGENRCSVTIGFRALDGDSYALTRSLDIDGNHSARLCHTDDPETPIALGTDQVAEAMFGLISFGYDEFVESFYLAQREITSPHPHSLTLKTIAGISTLERGAALITQDLQRDDADIKQQQAKSQATMDELTAMEIDPELLDSLLAEQSKSNTDKQQITELIRNYETAQEEYLSSYPRLIGHTTLRNRLSFWLTVSLLLVVTLFAAWVALLINPDLRDSWLSILVPYLPDSIGWMLLAALPLALLIRHHKEKIKVLRQAGKRLAALIDEIISSPNMPEESSRQSRGLSQQAANNSIDGEALAQEMRPVLKYIHGLQESYATRLQQLIEPIRMEQERRHHAATLEQHIQEINSEIESRSRFNQARGISIELLAGASRHLSRRFNHVIREHVGMTLPLFTEGRYEHLQIDDDMSIRVFSNEKRGYLDLDEISSGTQRQIMLAVRLALSQELASRRVRSSQFLILDEPFAFFDQERTINSLSVLPELSEDLPQIFVTSQVFPPGSTFQREIACSRESKSLQ
jgi:DNA repair protein SbcC/Rad50